MASYHKALRLKPDFAEAHYNLGRVLQELGRLDEAVVHYHKAIDIKPDYVEAYNNLGAPLQALGQIDDAINNYQKALSFNPDFGEALYNLGTALLDLGRHKEGLKYIQDGKGLIEFSSDKQTHSFTILGGTLRGANQ